MPFGFKNKDIDKYKIKRNNDNFINYLKSELNQNSLGDLNIEQ